MGWGLATLFSDSAKFAGGGEIVPSVLKLSLYLTKLPPPKNLKNLQKLIFYL